MLATRTTTAMIFIGYVWNLTRSMVMSANARKLSSSVEAKTGFAEIYFTLTQIDFSIFLFYLADEIERFFLVLLFLPTAYAVRKLHAIFQELAKDTSHRKRVAEFVSSFLIFTMLFKCLQIIYFAFKGTLTLDINLQAGNKTIGEY